MAYDDYSDMKQLYGRKVVETITQMTSDEILAMDRYDEDGCERARAHCPFIGVAPLRLKPRTPPGP